MPERSTKGACRARRLLDRIEAFLADPGDWKFEYGDLAVGSPLRIHIGERDADEIAGITVRKTDTVYVDYRHDVIATILHECLHVIYPAWTEKGVAQAEKLILRHMTPYDAARLHRLFGERLYPR